MNTGHHGGRELGRNEHNAFGEAATVQAEDPFKNEININLNELPMHKTRHRTAGHRGNASGGKSAANKKNAAAPKNAT